MTKHQELKKMNACCQDQNFEENCFERLCQWLPALYRSCFFLTGTYILYFNGVILECSDVLAQTVVPTKWKNTQHQNNLRKKT